jgi:hypothetical protein
MLCADVPPASAQLTALEATTPGDVLSTDALTRRPVELNAVRLLAAEKMVSHPRFLDMVRAFEAAGGAVTAAPSMEEVSAAAAAGTPFAVHVRPEDFCVPMCHEGFNRAQIMYLALHGLKRRCGVTPARVSLPHGAESGFDPYQAYADLHATNVYGYIHGAILPDAPGDYLSRCFEQVFGVQKARRIGQEYAEAHGLALNPADDGSSAEDYATLAAHRSAQRAAMDALLFTPDRLRTEAGPGGRVLLFCFGRASGHFLSRVLEASPSASMAGLHVIVLPFPDTVSRAGSPADIAAHFRTTGQTVDKLYMSCLRHEEVYRFMASLLRIA